MQETNRFGIEVNFLTGRYVATSHNDRRQSEWPPHPARLFSALVATWADSDEPRRDERDTLEWLEAQGPPEIAAEVEAVPRKVVSHFVPVNDTTIVGPAWHQRQAEKVADTIALLRDASIASDGEATREVQRLQNRLDKQRDVRSQVSTAGKTSAESAQKLFPDKREKRERHFPSVTLDLQTTQGDMPTGSPRVTFIWHREMPASKRDVLDGLLARLTRLGHSSSLVSCRVINDAPPPTLVPSPTGTTKLRHVRQGQLAELERRFARHRGISPRALPYTDVAYEDADSEHADTVDTPTTSGDWIVFEFLAGSRVFPATRAEQVATTLRSTIFSYAPEPIPEGLSGHRPDGSPSSDPHVAFVPLPFAGYQHADGRLLGVAVSVPVGMDEASSNALYQAIGRWERDTEEDEGKLKLVFGHRGELWMRRLRGPAAMASLRRTGWRRANKRWASVTPIALPRHPGRLRGGTPQARARAWQAAEDAVRAAVGHVGLPEPSAVEVSLAPFLMGARAASGYPPFRQPGPEGTLVRRQLVHAVVTFDRPVQGPLMLGSGRFVGLGLMRPLPGLEPQASGADATSDKD